MLGEVVSFDEVVGLGVISSADGASYRFHCIEIVDGSRTIAPGTPVEFELLPKLGRYEAAVVTKLATSS